MSSEEGLKEMLRQRGLIVSGNPTPSHLEKLLELVLFPLVLRNDSVTRKLVLPIQRLCETEELVLAPSVVEFLADFIPFLCHELTSVAIVERNKRVEEFKAKINSGREEEEDLDLRLTSLDFQNVYRTSIWKDPKGQDDELFSFDEQLARKLYDKTTTAITIFSNVFLTKLKDNPDIWVVIEKFGEEVIQGRLGLYLPVSVIGELIRESSTRKSNPPSFSSSAVIYETSLLEMFLLGLLEDANSFRTEWGSGSISLDMLLFANRGDKLFDRRLNEGLKAYLQDIPVPKVIAEVIWNFTW